MPSVWFYSHVVLFVPYLLQCSDVCMYQVYPLTIMCTIVQTIKCPEELRDQHNFHYFKELIDPDAPPFKN